ncbi:OmpA family protein [Acinetobacter sp. YH12138]|nr:OmpA family protein [Acinetobacter sp. YH12138]
MNNLLLTVDNNGKPIILNNDGTTINNCPIRENALNNVIKPIEPSLDNINLAADSLFKFNGGKLTDLLPAGKSSLNELATKLNNQYARIDMIKLTGHTDRLGSEKYNQQLALQRALTVKNYLMNQGIAADKLSFASAGETQPVTNGCFDVQDRNALKACLQADRRVDVQILGIKKP